MIRNIAHGVTAALTVAVVVTAFITLDGESNWPEGAMLCGVYIIAALAFFFSP